MSIEFENPLTAGTVLVREDIRSQDFVEGVSGWRIEANGSAEFNDITIRGSDGVPAVIVGPDGEPQVVIYSNGANGVLEFPTNDPNEQTPARIASVVYNQGAAAERMALEIQGPAHDVDSNRLAVQLNSANANGSAPARLNIFDVATQDLILYLENGRVQVSEILQVAPEATASTALHVIAANGHTGRLIEADVNGVDKFVVDASGNTAIAGSVTAANIASGTAQTPAPGGVPAQTSVNVTFAAAFPSTPNIVVTPNSGAANLNTSNIRWAVTNKSTTGFTINCWRDTNAATNFEWFAHI